MTDLMQSMPDNYGANQLTALVLIMRDSASKSDLDKLELRFNDKIDKLETKFDDKIDKLEAKFDDRIDKLETKFDDRIDKLEAKFDDRIDKLDDKIDKLEMRVNARIDKLDARVDKLDDKIENVKAELKYTENRLATMIFDTNKVLNARFFQLLVLIPGIISGLFGIAKYFHWI